MELNFLYIEFSLLKTFFLNMNTFYLVGYLKLLRKQNEVAQYSRRLEGFVGKVFRKI